MKIKTIGYLPINNKGKTHPAAKGQATKLTKVKSKTDKIIQRVILDKYVVFYKGNIYTNRLRNPKVLTSDVLGIDASRSKIINRLTTLIEDHQKTLDTLKNSCVVVTMENGLMTMAIVLL